MPTPGSDLTAKQKAFAEQYIIDNNATAAYERAGYKTKNLNSAGAAASRLLGNVRVLRYVQYLQEQRSQRLQLSADDVLEEIARIAKSNIADVVDITPLGIVVKNGQQLSRHVTAAISEITCTETERGVTTRVKLHDKISALNLAAKHTGLTSDLNQAIATFRRYGYEVRQTPSGYEFIDTYASSDPEKSTADTEEGEDWYIPIELLAVNRFGGTCKIWIYLHKKADLSLGQP